MRPVPMLLCLAALFTPASAGARPAAGVDPQLVRTSGPGGGDVLDLVRSAEGGLLAATPTGLYRSADGGWSWGPVATPADLVQLDASPSGRIFGFAVTRTYALDPGGDWFLLAEAPSGLWRIVVDGAGVAFGATRSTGLYRSTDDGLHWEPTALAAVGVTALDLGAGGGVYAGLGVEVQGSTSGGLSWDLVATLPHPVSCVAERVEGGLYVGVDRDFFAGPPAGGVYVVEAGTATWSGLADHRIVGFIARADRVFAASAGSCYGFGCGGGGVYWSDDGGGDWSPTGLGGAAVTALVVAGPDAMFAATAGHGTDIGAFPSRGVLRASGPGIDWVASNRGLGGDCTFALASGGEGVLYAATGLGVWRTLDHGVAWEPAPAVPPRHVFGEQSISFALAVHPNGFVFALPNGGPLSCSPDAGGYWVELPLDGFVYDGLPSLVVTPAGTLLVADDAGGVHRSTDLGWSWQRETAGLPPAPLVDLAVGGVGLVGASGPAALYVSTDDGVHWSEIAGVGGNLAIASDDQTVAVVGWAGAWRATAAGGGSWQLEPLAAIADGSDAAVVFDSQGSLFVTNGSGVHRLGPGDSSWTPVGAPAWGFVLQYRPALAVGHDGYLYATSTGEGVYRSRAPLMEPTDAVGGVDAHSRLLAHFPNPVRGRATFAFALAGPTVAELCMYDVRGRLLARPLAGRRLGSGRHTLSWDVPAGWAPGVYLYELRAGDASRSGRMLVLD